MSDLISRKKVLTILNRHTRSGGRDVDGDYVPPDITIGAKQEIKELPPEQPEPHWIPCSEYLPKKNGTYIVTEKVFSVDDYHHKGKYQIKVEPVDFFGGAFMRAPYFEVLAWMPLPAPFQPKEDAE